MQEPPNKRLAHLDPGLRHSRYRSVSSTQLCRESLNERDNGALSSDREFVNHVDYCGLLHSPSWAGTFVAELAEPERLNEVAA